MKKNEFIEVKQLAIKDLVAKVLLIKKELASLLIDKHTGKMKDTNVMSKKRKDIAQMLTVVYQKQLLERLQGEGVIDKGKALSVKGQEPKGLEEKKEVKKIKSIKKGKTSS